MANENQNKTQEQLAAEKLAADKKLAEKPQMPAAGKTTPEYKLDANGDPITGNFTRDAIIQFQRGKFVEQGKSAEEATELAVKRGFEMVKEEPEKK